MLAEAVAIILVVAWLAAAFYGPGNVSCSNGVCVHRAHSNMQGARSALTGVRELLFVTVAYLRHKYAHPAATPAATAREFLGLVQPGQFATPQLRRLDAARLTAGFGAVPPNAATRAALTENVNKILRRWNPENVQEGSPFNVEGETAYTVSHGDEMVYCLRKKQWQAPLHEFELLGFVALHELTHVFTKGFAHPERFWEHFRWVLHETEAAGIYKSKDYSQAPAVYCGLKVDHNPATDGVTAAIWELHPNQWGSVS
jgi:hypothetical protein